MSLTSDIGIDLEFKWVHIWILNHAADFCYIQFMLIPSYRPLAFTRSLSPSHLGYVNSSCICLILNNTCDQM